MDEKKVIVLISISSDIGIALAKRYSELGYTIIGTYRSLDRLEELRMIPGCDLFFCDLNDRKSINNFINNFKQLNLKWTTFISCSGNPLPLKAFFKCDFEEWNDSVYTNVIGQLHILHQIYPYRNNTEISNVVYLAGVGTNNAVVNFSAYIASKIMLMKMCELLDAENKDLNIFIVGPGWTKTKTHNLILENTIPSDEKHIETINFLENKEGTSMDDIFNCIKWLCEQGKEISGGRNFSVVYDDWKGEKNKKLVDALKSDNNMYKLRRYKNKWE